MQKKWRREGAKKPGERERETVERFGVAFSSFFSFFPFFLSFFFISTSSLTLSTSPTPPPPPPPIQASPAEAVKDAVEPVKDAVEDVKDAVVHAVEEVTGGEEEEEAGAPPPAPAEIAVQTSPHDARFPATNQSRHCYTRYNEYYRCVAQKGEEDEECKFVSRGEGGGREERGRRKRTKRTKKKTRKKTHPFSPFYLSTTTTKQTNKQYQRAYRSICPSEWLEKWAEQREAGEFCFFLFFVFFFRNLGGFFFLSTFLFSLWLFSVPFFSTLETTPNRYLRRQVLGGTIWSRGAKQFFPLGGMVRAERRAKK